MSKKYLELFMKKMYAPFFLPLIGSLVLLAGCTTVAPLQSNVAFPQDGSKYTILGRVTLDAKAGKNSYERLLAAAQKAYPDADDVVNIFVDRKVKRFFFMTTYHYVLSGVAIDYKEVK